ncbi:hypothetical protein VARIO8X_120328 [Burkholderiales bacterium 8X]|nr:hypothetical protein VARIO8X_120328 [Burkholderiales bacterium 8X]
MPRAGRPGGGAGPSKGFEPTARSLFQFDRGKSYVETCNRLRGVRRGGPVRHHEGGRQGGHERREARRRRDAFAGIACNDARDHAGCAQVVAAPPPAAVEARPMRPAEQ